MSGLPLGLILFNVLINDLHNTLEYIVIKFMNDPKFGGVVAMMKVWAAIQRNLTGQEKWIDRNLTETWKTRMECPVAEAEQPHTSVKAVSLRN